MDPIFKLIVTANTVKEAHEFSMPIASIMWTLSVKPMKCTLMAKIAKVVRRPIIVGIELMNKVQMISKWKNVENPPFWFLF